MKRLSYILIMFFSSTCYAQFPRDIEILEIRNLNLLTDSLVSKIDKLNPNSLKRLSVLDSAAKHHAEYLILLYLNNNYISHLEDKDFPNFDEKLRAEDRTGFQYQTSEIITLNSRASGFNENYFLDDAILRYKNPQFNFFSCQEVLNQYKNSAPHLNIIQDSNNNYFGSYTILVFYKTTRDLPQYYLNQGMIYLRYTLINVSVFIQHL